MISTYNPLQMVLFSAKQLILALFIQNFEYVFTLVGGVTQYTFVMHIHQPTL